MTWFRRFLLCLTSAAVLWAAAGCSGQKVNQVRVDEVAQEKVSLMRRLADEVAKNPSSVDVAGLVEEFMNTPFDPQAHPAEAAEILKIYNERVKGKIRGDAAVHIQAAVNKSQPGGKGK
jgi:hypothetical protein